MEKPKILLINPPLEGHINTGIDNLKVPLSLAYLASYLEKNRYDNIKILDALAEGELTKVKPNLWHAGLSYEKIKEHIKEFNPNIIGITCSGVSINSRSLVVIIEDGLIITFTPCLLRSVKLAFDW